MKELEVNLTMFDSIKHIDLDGNEYWSARELQKVLGYKRWDKFSNVINDAKVSCKNSNNSEEHHFSQVGKMVKTGDSIRNIKDYKLSRYACTKCRF